jgi:hypothetical protein
MTDSATPSPSHSKPEPAVAASKSASKPASKPEPKSTAPAVVPPRLRMVRLLRDLRVRRHCKLRPWAVSSQPPEFVRQNIDRCRVVRPGWLYVSAHNRSTHS